jgi:lactate dehydrogenase-like 2-hydroxyacid dehydrogenase
MVAGHIADSVSRAYDLEGMDVGVIAAGRIGQAVLRRLAPFDVRLRYFDTHRLPPEVPEVEERARVDVPPRRAIPGQVG